MIHEYSGLPGNLMVRFLPSLIRVVGAAFDLRIVCFLLLLCSTDLMGAPSDLNVARTEARTPCVNVDPLGKPLFGDLHVHTQWHSLISIKFQKSSYQRHVLIDAGREPPCHWN